MNHNPFINHLLIVLEKLQYGGYDIYDVHMVVSLKVWN